jgi:uncharacterized membrane protein YhaH (DUF805 family)
MDIKTIEELNEKMWYRLLKTIYILIFIILLLYFNINAFQYRFRDDYWQAIFINNLFIYFLFEFFRRLFYYIVLKKIKPNKKLTLKNMKDVKNPTKKEIIKNLFKGRIKRLEYFLGVVLFPIIIFYIYIYSINYLFLLAAPNSVVVHLIFLLVPIVLLLLFDIALSIRRLHDIGWNGIFTLLIFIPGVGQLFFLILLFVSGDEKENKYGLQPTKKTDALDVLREIINLNLIKT